MIKKCVCCVILSFSFFISALSADVIGTINVADLPASAQEVISKIKAGSTDWPFPKNDGIHFGNREKQLPTNNHASYKEYTVCTEQMSSQLARGKRPNRGTRRIIHDVKNDIYYYTDDHYKTFRKVVF